MQGCLPFLSLIQGVVLQVGQSEQVLETGRRLMVSSSQVRIRRSSRRMDFIATRPVLSHTNLGLQLQTLRLTRSELA